MTDKANGRRGPSHIARMSSKDTSSDTLQDAKRSGSHQAESDERLSKMEHARQQSAPEDRCKRTPGENLHVFQYGNDAQPASIPFRLGARRKRSALLYRNSRS